MIDDYKLNLNDTYLYCNRDSASNMDGKILLSSVECSSGETLLQRLPLFRTIVCRTVGDKKVFRAVNINNELYRWSPEVKTFSGQEQRRYKREHPELTNLKNFSGREDNYNAYTVLQQLNTGRIEETKGPLGNIYSIHLSAISGLDIPDIFTDWYAKLHLYCTNEGPKVYINFFDDWSFKHYLLDANPYYYDASNATLKSIIYSRLKYGWFSQYVSNYGQVYDWMEYISVYVSRKYPFNGTIPTSYVREDVKAELAANPEILSDIKYTGNINAQDIKNFITQTVTNFINEYFEDPESHNIFKNYLNRVMDIVHNIIETAVATHPSRVAIDEEDLEVDLIEESFKYTPKVSEFSYYN